MQGNTPQNQGSAGQSGSGKPTLSWTSSQQKLTPPTTPPVVPPAQPPKNNSNNTQKTNPNNPQKSNMPTYAGIFVGGLVVGVLVGWSVVGMRGSDTTATTVNNDNQASTTTTTSMTNTSGSGTTMDLSGSTVGAAGLTITDPQAAGLEVAVAKAVVSAPTWVIVYEDHNGVPGNALGASLFFPASQGTLARHAPGSDVPRRRSARRRRPQILDGYRQTGAR
jgi:hypothetical protein